VESQSQGYPNGIFGGPSGAGAGLSLSILIFPASYHSTNMPLSYLPSKTGTVGLFVVEVTRTQSHPSPRAKEKAMQGLIVFFL
jgi:hypothetical protein